MNRRIVITEKNFIYDIKEQWIFKAIDTGTTTSKMDFIDLEGKLETASINIEVKVI